MAVGKLQKDHGVMGPLTGVGTLVFGIALGTLQNITFTPKGMLIASTSQLRLWTTPQRILEQTSTFTTRNGKRHRRFPDGVGFGHGLEQDCWL
mmetsp:Transcript_11573/g.26792  ORF Transcript_11573/g.26792 Transcript_11573/m.26792 type:complete len:93 (+) Transcript_11573:453-731(+)